MIGKRSVPCQTFTIKRRKAIMKYYSETLACVNRSDEYDLVRKKLENHGYWKTENPQEADVIMIYTCGSTSAFISRSVTRTKELARNYEKKMIVCGCSTVTSLKSYEDTGFLLCNPTDFSNLEEFLDDQIKQEELRNAQITDDPIFNQKTIVIQKGCIRKCAYCGIWRAVGKLFSKTPESVLLEVKKLIKSGVYNITLSGDSIADYGLDFGSNIIELLNLIGYVDEKVSFNLLDFHPRMFIKYMNELIAFAQKEKIKHIGIPIQSGSEDILKAMRREFNMEKFVFGLDEIRKCGVDFSTDIIIGFPGETDEDFNKTIALLKRLDFSKITVNVYTDLEDSISSRMPNKISKKKIMKRYITIKESGLRGIDNDFLDYQISKVVYGK